MNYTKQRLEEFDEKFGKFKYLSIDESGQDISATPENIKQFLTETIDQVRADLRHDYDILVKTAIDTTRDETDKKWEKKIEGMKGNWKPTCGHDSEEEKGFQKGIMAEQKLHNKALSDLLDKEL